jgi:pimeloyl-ACP methyl ester carboxylesterase
MAARHLLLVHGAFHGAWCWDRLQPELARRDISYDAVDLPFTSTADDVATVRRALDRSDKEVAVLGHSFGGAVISAAAAEDGVPYGAATSLIYLTAFMTAPGQVIDFSGSPGMTEIEIGEATARVDPSAAPSVFYNRCSAEDATWAAERLRSMPSSVLLASPPARPAWEALPSVYITCSDDRVVSMTAQEQMAANATRTIRIDSDHSPFLSCPGSLADVLRGIVS